MVSRAKRSATGQRTTKRLRVNRARTKRTRRRTRMGMGSGVLSDPRASAWDQLIRDPCSANLAHPPYAGMDSGYLIRTVDVFQVVGSAPGPLTVGATVPLDFAVSYSPAATGSGSTNAGFLAMGIAPGGAASQAVVSSGTGTYGIISPVRNFINSSTTVVKRYRPVAACLKWLPSGAFSARAGYIGMGYSPGSISSAGEVSSPADWFTLSQKNSSNGSSTHEVRWLPTSADENFTSNSITVLGGGTVFLAGRTVDATVASATTAIANGVVEVTTVWEWEPISGVGTAVAPKAPAPYTTQQILSTIGDLGNYLFEGVRTEASGSLYAAGRGMVRGAVNSAYGLLTKGIQQTATRGLPMLMF